MIMHFDGLRIEGHGGECAKYAAPAVDCEEDEKLHAARHGVAFVLQDLEPLFGSGWSATRLGCEMPRVSFLFWAYACRRHGDRDVWKRRTSQPVKPEGNQSMSVKRRRGETAKATPVFASCLT